MIVATPWFRRCALTRAVKSCTATKASSINFISLKMREADQVGHTPSIIYIYIMEKRNHLEIVNSSLSLPVSQWDPSKGCAHFALLVTLLGKRGVPAVLPSSFIFYFSMWPIQRIQGTFLYQRSRKKEKRAERVKLHRRSSAELYYVYPRNLVEHRLLAHNVSHLSRSHHSVI